MQTKIHNGVKHYEGVYIMYIVEIRNITRKLNNHTVV